LSYQHACEGDSAALTHAFDVVSAHTLIAIFVIWILHEARTLSRAGCAGDQSAAQVHSVVPRLVYGRCWYNSMLIALTMTTSMLARLVACSHLLGSLR
jgi:hypothetical protein